MTGIQSYSTTASENVNANTGINWDEGMAPAAINNSARQNMADIRGQHNDLIWFQYGSGSKAPAPTYSSGTIFTQASGSDLSAIYHVGRRVKAVGSGTGTIYGTISATSYGSSTQTVTVVWDSGSLSNETITVYLSQIPKTGQPMPARAGTATNDNAAAGDVGEYTSSVIASGSAVALTTATVANVTSISLTAGDWDVSGSVGFSNSGSGVTGFIAGISNLSAAFPPDTGVRSVNSLGTTSTASQVLPLARTRALLSTTTTIYLVAQASFTGGGVSASGCIEARRVR